MADGLSLIASIIAVLGAADSIGKTLSQLRILRDAPDELLALNNEISDLTLTLRHVDNCISTATTEGTSTTDGRAVPQDAFHQLSTLITRAKDQILQLEQLIHYHLLKSGSFDGDYNVFRVRWARSRSTVENYRKALRDVRQNIVMQLLIINSSLQSRANLTIHEVFAISNQIQATQLRSVEQAFTQMNAQAGILTNIANDNVRLRNTLESVIHNDAQHQTSRPARNPHFHSVLGVRAYVLNPQLHRRLSQCRCSYHGPRSLRSPCSVDRILGTLFVGYFGYPFNMRRCASIACQAHSAFVARVQYFFPSWLIHKMIELSLISWSSQEPHLALTVRAVLPPTAKLFRLALKDDGDGLQRLFRHGNARPNDLVYGMGSNALHFTIQYRSLKACKVLLAAGSDPYYEDITQTSAIERVWNMLLTASEDQTRLKALCSLFPDNNGYLETYQFSKLHKTILGLISCNLEEVIATNYADVNMSDSGGRTALSLAVRRGDVLATKLLLKANADPNIASFSGDMPLVHAVARGNLVCVILFLDAGALTTHKNNNHTNALHYAAFGRDDCCSTPDDSAFHYCATSKIIKLLVASGLSVEAQNKWGYNPLHITVVTKNIHRMQALLDCGGSPNSLDFEGNTSIMTSIYYGNSKATSILLSHGVDYTLMNKAGNTILHYAARGGGLETLEGLRAANLINVNPYAQNIDGKTAPELAQKRMDRPNGFIDVFLTLIFEICNRNDYLAGHGTTSTGTIIGEVAGDMTDNTGIEEPLKIPGAWPQQ